MKPCINVPSTASPDTPLADATLHEALNVHDMDDAMCYMSSDEIDMHYLLEYRRLRIATERDQYMDTWGVYVTEEDWNRDFDAVYNTRHHIMEMARKAIREEESEAGPAPKKRRVEE